MEQRLSLVTLGVDDLAAQTAFYRDTLGWKVEAQNKDIVFFKISGLLFSLFGREPLAAGAGLSAEGSGFRALTLGIILNTKEEVDACYHELEAKGISILKRPMEVPFGAYVFIFKDPEGNLIEVANNPFILLDEKGDVITHKSIDHL